MTDIQDHRASGKPADSGPWGIGLRLARRWPFLRRADFFNIGVPDNPMMCRWRLLRTPRFGLYVHYIYREDLDPVPHDHPWRFWSLVLRGGYREIYWPDAGAGETSEYRGHGRCDGIRWRLQGFPLVACHRIVHVEPRTVTLVLVGRKLRSWGFYDFARGDAFVDWRDALGIRPTEGARSTGKYPRG